MKKLITYLLLFLAWTNVHAQENELIVRSQTEHEGTNFVPWGQFHYKKLAMEGRFNFDHQLSAAFLTGIQLGHKKVYCNLSCGVIFGQYQGFMPQVKFGVNRYNCEIFSISEYVFGFNKNNDFALHNLTAMWVTRKHLGFGIEEEFRYFPPTPDAEKNLRANQEFAVGPVVKKAVGSHFFAEAWYGFGLRGSSRLHMGLGYKFE